MLKIERESLVWEEELLDRELYHQYRVLKATYHYITDHSYTQNIEI